MIEERSLSHVIPSMSESRWHNLEFIGIASGLWCRGVRVVFEEVVDCLKVEGVGLK